MDDYPEMKTTIANLKNKRNSDSVITKVTEWLETDSAPTANICSIGEKQKYLKQIRRIFREDGTLYRKYFVQD